MSETYFRHKPRQISTEIAHCTSTMPHSVYAARQQQSLLFFQCQLQCPSLLILSWSLGNQYTSEGNLEVVLSPQSKALHPSKTRNILEANSSRPRPHWTRRQKRRKLGCTNPVVATVLYTLHAKQCATQRRAHKWDRTSVDGAQRKQFRIVVRTL